jgi:hypothetical protein
MLKGDKGKSSISPFPGSPVKWLFCHPEAKRGINTVTIYRIEIPTKEESTMS